MPPLLALLLLGPRAGSARAAPPAIELLGTSASDPAAAEGVSERLEGMGRRGERERRERVPPPPRLPDDFLALPVVQQTTDYSCGPAALASAMRYLDAFRGPETALHRDLHIDPHHGSSNESLVEVARRYGLRAELREELELADLRRGLRRGQAIILDIQAWREPKDRDRPWRELWEDGHSVALVGMDRHYAYFMDPWLEGRYGYVPLRELLERWHDYDDRDGPRREYRRAAVFIRGGGRSAERGERPALARIE